MVTGATGARTQGSVAAPLIATVVLITAVAPLATDMYVPGFPQVAADLDASVTAVQLTLTTFFIGMALGQLAGGPVSDQRGRRALLIAGAVLLTIASVGCALAPTIELMSSFRFLQGFGGGWAMVIARAVIVDLATGPQLVRVLNVVAGVGGLGPIVGPLLGGVLLQLTGWRVSFWVLVGAGVLMVAAAILFVPESLPAARRHGGGFRTFGSAARVVLGNRHYVGYAIVSAASMSAVFAYVSTSAFILQQLGGLTPIAYSLDFAGNAAAMAVVSLVVARYALRVPTRRFIVAGLLTALVAGGGLLVAGATGSPVWLVMLCFLAIMLNLGLSLANAGALASTEVPDHPGTGSAVLGALQWLAAGVTAPIAGLLAFGITTSAGLIVVISALIGLIALLVVARHRVAREGSPHDRA